MEHLRNRYVVMRHGKSLANEQKIIVSHHAYGVPSYGLIAEGQQQARMSVEKAFKQSVLDSESIIVSSDFSRAKETAEIAAEVLGTHEQVLITPKLRERFFGAYDGTENTNYEKVWADDRLDAAHTNNGVESVEEVLARAMSLISDIEKEYAGKTILLVSHGDTLQILQTAFEKVHPSTHRTLQHLEPAEIRTLD
ncbi:MAG TPA: histidine phosphatase family protein [Candidatus Paceibacterota bacterium]|nr:histidine phosphatase family protein [Candidatus Paceibacterota bacterium]